VWGASGYTYDSTYHGGYGGYSTGIQNASKNTVDYINVGQLGFGTCTANSTYGPTYNGADQQTLDSSTSQSVYNRCSGAGGGATHIATVSGVLKNLSSYKDTGGTNISKEILIVAGGGGGSHASIGAWTCAARKYIGGNAGGYQSSIGTDQNGENGNKSYNATQTSGYAFGLGGAKTPNIGSSGGGGWYGGYTTGECAGGGGGSGYIASSNLISTSSITKHMTCYSCTTSSVAATRTNSNTNVSATATADYSKTGNGYAKITYLGPTI